MAGKHKSIPRNGVYLPNASHLGFDRYMVRRGDLVLFTLSEKSILGRALDLVTHDHEGKEYRKATGRGQQTKRAPLLRVLAFNDMLSHAYELWVDVEAVTYCRAPGTRAFAAWLLTGPLPSTEIVLAASQHGSLSDHYFDRCADADGNLSEGWRERTDGKHREAMAAARAKAESKQTA